MKKFFLFFVLVGCFTSCELPEIIEPKVLNGEALGTYYSMTYFDEEHLDISMAIDSTFNAINASMSTYIKDSDISKMNRGKRIQADHMFVENFVASKKIHDLTNGYFDPTVGILVNYYGFGPQKMNLEINQRNTDSLMQYVGFDKVNLSEDNYLIKAHDSIFLDFNAIAKGYAVDRLGHLLESYGILNYIIDIGGEIVAKGKNLQREGPWRVGIDRPSEGNDERAYDYVLTLDDKAIATSGNYRKYNEDESGNKFVHTINPKTGKSEKSDVLSASVLASDCMTADAYATAFMSMGFDSSKKILDEIEVDAVLIYVDDNNESQTFVSENLRDFIEKIE